MSNKHFVITIERQYGSGGRLTGKRLAEELGIHFYDEEILKMTSETSAIGEQYFRLADEKAGNNLLYRIVTGMKPELTEPERDGHHITSPENLFRFQSSVIRGLAASEPCIIVGRCGNYVLQDQMDNLIRIFVYADTVTRIRRVMDVDKVDEAEALRRMKRIDKERTEYHRYFTGREWMDMENYDLPINASRIDYDQMIQLIKDYLKLRGFLEGQPHGQTIGQRYEHEYFCRNHDSFHRHHRGSGLCLFPEECLKAQGSESVPGLCIRGHGGCVRVVPSDSVHEHEPGHGEAGICTCIHRLPIRNWLFAGTGCGDSPSPYGYR